MRIGFWQAARLLFRDLFLHFFQGTICLVRRRHRALVLVGELRKPGFRGVPLMQCRKCFAFYLSDGAAKRIGGKAA